MSSSQADLLASLSEPDRLAILDSLTEEQLRELEWDWRFWGRPEQHLPPLDQLTDAGRLWDTWLLLAGRGFGKTRTMVEASRELICGSTPLGRGLYGQVAIVAETSADARDVIVEGPAGILKSYPKDFRPLYEPSKRRLTWPNGAIATLYNAVEPDQLRGPQHDLAMCDETAKWQYAQETYDQLQFGLRLGNRPLQIHATTPRPIPLIRHMIAQPGTLVTRGSTLDNRSNLASSFIENIQKRYEGTRLGRQELYAEILDDVPGALWTHAMLDAARRHPPTGVPDFLRVVVAVDPSGIAEEDDLGDSQGIVVAGLGVDGRGYVIEDASCRLSPDGWGRRAYEKYLQHRGDRIVYERNYGGAMVAHVLQTVNKGVPLQEVVASRGKVVRAEPVAALYEQGRVTHVEPQPELEDQMLKMTRGGYLGDGSPDRVDALVWALTHLMVEDGADLNNWAVLAG